jgi:hypothetical protein
MEDKSNERAVARVLRETITDEIFAAFGLASRGLPRRLFGPLFWLPTQIFGRIMAGVDRTVGEQGVPEAAKHLLSYFVDNVQVTGKENIPQEGPVLIASNHPGAYDSVAILACLSRKDVKVVVSDIPFLRSMPAASKMMVYATPGTQGRMTAVRGVVRQMQDGGALMIFPSGLVDPDPDVLPEAEQELNSWSGSLDLVMKKVPETRIIVTMVSGVLSPICLRNPLTRLMKKEWEQRKLAEFLQVIQQLALKRKFDLKPRLTFDVALTGSELLAQSRSPDLHQAIIERARQVLKIHMDTAPSPGL